MAAESLQEFDLKKLFTLDGKTITQIKNLADALLDTRTKNDQKNDPLSVEEVMIALTRLAHEGTLVIPSNITDSDLLQLGSTALKFALGLSGDAGLATLASTVAIPLTGAAIRWVRTCFNRCGGVETDRSKPADQDTSVIVNNKGRHVVIYYVEYESGAPLLPPIDGSQDIAMSCLSLALQRWSIRLKADIVRTGNLGDSHLVINSRKFSRAEAPDEVVALTDIGPPGGLLNGKHLQLRMTFDLNETFTETEFTATACHEFGHFLGIRHRDVQPHGRQLMNDTLSDIVRPQEHDLLAAGRKGWIRS